MLEVEGEGTAGEKILWDPVLGWSWRILIECQQIQTPQKRVLTAQRRIFSLLLAF